PGGTGRSFSSSTYSRTPGSGTPIGTDVAACSGAHSHRVEFTVASVGPLQLSIRYLVAHRCTSSAGTFSAPHSTMNPAGNSVSSGNIPSTDGPIAMWVTRWRRVYSASGSPGTRRSAGTTTRVPPLSSPMHISQNATSKLGEANCSTRLLESTPTRSAWVASSLATPRCGTTTPLGLPVEPEV